MPHQPAPPTATDLMAKVGNFLLYWSSFEIALTKAINEAQSELRVEHTNIRGGLKERLDVWAELAAQLPENTGQSDTVAKVHQQALKLRDVRNLIVHGLLNFNAHPHLGTAVHIQCVVGGFEEPTGEIVAYTMDDLEHFLQGVDACRRALLYLRAFNYMIDD